METIQGVRTKVVLVSQTHGAIRVPLEQTFNYTPKLTERTINEFDNLEAAAVVTSFDGVDVTFDYLDSDSALVDAAFADISPLATAIYDDPSNYKKVTVFANVKAELDGKIFASILCKQCRAKGSPYSEPVKEEASVTRDLSGTNVLKIKGAALLYTRILANSPAGSVYQQAVPPNVSLDKKFPASGPFTITLGETALLYGGKYDFYVMKNGAEVTTGYTAAATTFTVGSAPATTDIWEVWSLYTD